MPEFSTNMRLHAQVSDIRCILCEAVYQQFFVGVILFEGDQPIGSVCAHCLSESPGRCAREVRVRADRLWDQAGEAAWHSALAQGQSPRVHAQVMADHAGRERDELLRAVGRPVREAARRAGMDWPGPARPAPEPATVEEKEDRANLLYSLAEGIELFPEWPTSLETLRDFEQVAVQANLPGVPAEEVRRLVEARYDKLIATTA